MTLYALIYRIGTRVQSRWWFDEGRIPALETRRRV